MSLLHFWVGLTQGAFVYFFKYYLFYVSSLSYALVHYYISTLFNLTYCFPIISCYPTYNKFYLASLLHLYSVWPRVLYSSLYSILVFPLCYTLGHYYISFQFNLAFCFPIISCYPTYNKFYLASLLHLYSVWPRQGALFVTLFHTSIPIMVHPGSLLHLYSVQPNILFSYHILLPYLHTINFTLIFNFFF